MPRQKDLKRLVRTRMRKTGESYTSARLHVIHKKESIRNFAGLAGMSDESVQTATGRSWAEWVRLLDAAGATSKPHREIAAHVSSLGTPSWWSQMVTVGYERIRGLRERGQRRGADYRASKSRTYPVPLKKLFAAFANARLRRQWLTAAVTVRSSTVEKRMRLDWADGTSVILGFLSKGKDKSVVALQHDKLPDRATVDAMKREWSDHLDRLGEWLDD